MSIYEHIKAYSYFTCFFVVGYLQAIKKPTEKVGLYIYIYIYICL